MEADRHYELKTPGKAHMRKAKVNDTPYGDGISPGTTDMTV
jgi:hypothetical protein